MSTTIDRICTNGYSSAQILGVGLFGGRPLGIEDKRDPFYRAIVRLHKREVLAICEQRSIARGLRLEKRVLP